MLVPCISSPRRSGAALCVFPSVIDGVCCPDVMVIAARGRGKAL